MMVPAPGTVRSCQALHLESNGRNSRSGAVAAPRSRGTAFVVLGIYIRTSLVGLHGGGDARAQIDPPSLLRLRPRMRDTFTESVPWCNHSRCTVAGRVTGKDLKQLFLSLS